MRGESFAARSVFYMIVMSFAISLFGLLTDGYGCFLLATSQWLSTVGGVTLFGMLLVESLLLLAINLLCFGLIAFNGDRLETKQTNVEHLPYSYSPVFQSRNSRNELSSVWPSFTTPSDLYLAVFELRVKRANAASQVLMSLSRPDTSGSISC